MSGLAAAADAACQPSLPACPERVCLVMPACTHALQSSLMAAHPHRAGVSRSAFQRAADASLLPVRAHVCVCLGRVLTQIIPGVMNEPEWIHLWPCAVLTAFLMLIFGCMNGDQARRSIYWVRVAGGGSSGSAPLTRVVLCAVAYSCH